MSRAPKLYHLEALQSVPPLIKKINRFSWIQSGEFKHGKQVKDGQKRIVIHTFQSDWSTRKIYIARGIHQETIPHYKKEWEQSLQLASQNLQYLPKTNSEQNITTKRCQSAPLEGNKVPTEEVVHFQVPHDR